MDTGMKSTSLTIVFVIVIVFLVFLLMIFITAKTKEGYIDYKSTSEKNMKRFQKYKELI